MSLTVLCLCACLVFVPSETASNNFHGKVNSVLNQVNGGLVSLASVLRGLKRTDEMSQKKLSALTADVQQLKRKQTSQAVLDSVQKSIVELKASLQRFKAALPACPRWWHRRHGSCYKFTQCTSEASCTINYARTLCRKMGAELATIKSLQENYFVASLIDKSKFVHAFIGGRDDVSEKVWRWPDNSIAKYANWDNRQPDNCCGGQHCRLIWPRRGYRWDDAICNQRYKPSESGYVCQKAITKY